MDTLTLGTQFEVSAVRSEDDSNGFRNIKHMVGGEVRTIFGLLPKALNERFYGIHTEAVVVRNVSRFGIGGTHIARFPSKADRIAYCRKIAEEKQDTLFGRLCLKKKQGIEVLVVDAYGNQLDRAEIHPLEDMDGIDVVNMLYEDMGKRAEDNPEPAGLVCRKSNSVGKYTGNFTTILEAR